MGGESTIYFDLASHNVLPARSHCARGASSWYFSVLRWWCMAQDLQRWHVGSEVHHPGATFMNFSYGHVVGSSTTHLRSCASWQDDIMKKDPKQKCCSA